MIVPVCKKVIKLSFMILPVCVEVKKLSYVVALKILVLLTINIID